MKMLYSKTGLHLTEISEGVQLVAYKPFPTDPWTIGYGRTRGVNEGDTCTQAQAEVWLQEDIQCVVDQLNRDLVGKIALTQGEFDALVDFGFNLGMHALESSTLWRKILAGDEAGAAAEFPRWDMAGGKHIAGLLARRYAEQKEFTS